MHLGISSLPHPLRVSESDPEVVIFIRLRTLLHSPSLPPGLSFTESVIADVLRVCEVAKMLNLAFDIVVPVTSNSRFRKTIHSSMKDGVLKEEEEEE